MRTRLFSVTIEVLKDYVCVTIFVTQSARKKEILKLSGTETIYSLNLGKSEVSFSPIYDDRNHLILHIFYTYIIF